jgi:SAM-dependent methyltransferase
MNIISKIRRHGLIGSIKKVIKKFKHHDRTKNYTAIKHYLYGKKGLEIGGPSGMFSNDGYIPLYKIVKCLDGVNFSDDTIWTGNMGGGGRGGYVINAKRLGDLYIADAVNLAIIKDGIYDFVLSCNNIEHIANPMKAIQQWLLKLKKDGIILIIAPKKESNFDHKREIVKFEHILSDYNNEVAETDLSHVDEILSLHDLRMDPPAGSYEQFKIRSFDNFNNRCLHHHVFDLEILRKMFEYFDLKIIYEEEISSDYIIMGKK